MKINHIIKEFVAPQATAQDPGLEREKDVDVIFYGQMPQDFTANTVAEALEEVLPKEYPPGSSNTTNSNVYRVVTEIAKHQGAVVTTKPLSIAQKLVKTFQTYGIKCRIDSPGLEEDVKVPGPMRMNDYHDQADAIQEKLRQAIQTGNKQLIQQLSKQRDDLDAHVKTHGMMPEAFGTGLNEFAPAGSGDDGNDGFSDDTLKRLAAQWWNGDEDPKVEQTLLAAGWEIGQDEGYDDEPGVFVVQAGDVNGNSYMSWPAEELQLGEASLASMRDYFSQSDNNTVAVDTEYGAPDDWFDESREKVGNMDADAFDAALSRMKKLAGASPLKTVYDPARRVYKNVPHAVQPAQHPKKAR